MTLAGNPMVLIFAVAYSYRHLDKSKGQNHLILSLALKRGISLARFVIFTKDSVQYMVSFIQRTP